MIKYIFVLFIGLAGLSCQQNETQREWVYHKSIHLAGINPIGIASRDGELWLSDGDHNRLVQIDIAGHILKTIDSLDRPMHIDADEENLYIPEYGIDSIVSFHLPDHSLFRKSVFANLDAPAAISVLKAQKAVVDFYNNRIHYFDGHTIISFGKEGKKTGEFYYPTDVQITDSLIWVADAYNNRIQVFDKAGKFVKMIGQDQKMNAATGLFVSTNEVFITDFENDRVLVFDHEGNLKQQLVEGIAKATDLLVKQDTLYVINYRKGELVLYTPKEKISE
ncbi:MAG: hypothetical protein AAGB24_07805 [Bacteroidota bacterium]